MIPPTRTRVLVVDESAPVREALTRGLGADPEIDVVGAAADPREVREMVLRLKPDVITLDLEMSAMDGISFLQVMARGFPVPTVVVSSLSTLGPSVALQALHEGAFDVVAKPHADLDAMWDLIARLKAAARKGSAPRRASVPDPPVRNTRAVASTRDSVIGLGASTGGVSALSHVLKGFTASSPGIVVVQHMPAGFTADFAKRLDETCSMRVSEAKDGDRVVAGHVLIAPGGDRHLEVRRVGHEYRALLVPGPPHLGHVPSVDVFFRSLASAAGASAVACIMTGMGADGAAGLLELRRCGARTFAQDRETCAVWGMPAAALELGAAEACVPLGDLAARLAGAASGAGGPRPYSGE